MRISRSIMAVGGVVLAVAMIGFTNPKTVHAVVAALVQVTNTASNPVVTQSVGAQADNLVRLFCPVAVTDDDGIAPSICSTLLPNGEFGTGAFSVPSGQTLMVTGVDATPSPVFTPCTGPYVLTIDRPGSTSSSSRSTPFILVSIPNTPVTTQFRYSPGLAIGEGAINARVSPSGNTFCTTGFQSLFIYGYLTPA